MGGMSSGTALGSPAGEDVGSPGHRSEGTGDPRRRSVPPRRMAGPPRRRPRALHGAASPRAAAGATRWAWGPADGVPGRRAAERAAGGHCEGVSWVDVFADLGNPVSHTLSLIPWLCCTDRSGWAGWDTRRAERGLTSQISALHCRSFTRHLCSAVVLYGRAACRRTSGISVLPSYLTR